MTTITITYNPTDFFAQADMTNIDEPATLDAWEAAVEAMLPDLELAWRQASVDHTQIDGTDEDAAMERTIRDAMTTAYADERIWKTIA
jgi:hypothetical protein